MNCGGLCSYLERGPLNAMSTSRSSSVAPGMLIPESPLLCSGNKAHVGRVWGYAGLSWVGHIEWTHQADRVCYYWRVGSKWINGLVDLKWPVSTTWTSAVLSPPSFWWNSGRVSQFSAMGIFWIYHRLSVTLVSLISNYFLRKLVIEDDSSVGKMLALKVWYPEFDPQHPLKNVGNGGTCS